MTRFKPIIIKSLLSWLMMVLPSAAWSGEAVPIRIATHDQAPYGTYLPDKTFNGVAVKVMSCVFIRMKRPFVIEVYPWERTQMLAQRGEVDGFFPATIKPERLVWAEASAVIADQKWIWYLPADSTLDPNSAEFKATANVGAHFGSNRLKKLEADGYKVVLKPPTDEQLLLAFGMGRADAILGGDLAIAQAMKDNKIDPRKYRMVLATDNPLHAYFGRKFLKNESEFMARFNAQVPHCR
jgi:polar amino acid transport system substrate-binding protein